MKTACFFIFWCIVTSPTYAQIGGPSGKTADLSLTAVGRQHHPIQTKSNETQEYFDQGITLLYGFNHEEAQRAFASAGRCDFRDESLAGDPQRGK